MQSSVFHLEEDTNSPLLLSCEHASSYIPEEYENLGLTEDELRRAKDLNEPDVLAVARKVRDLLGGSLMYSQVSRLVSDSNRPPSAVAGGANSYHASAVKTELVCSTDREDVLVPIPGNQHLSSEEKLARYNTFTRPYFEAGKELVQRLLDRHGRVVIFSIHSFFPTYNGDVRSTDIDVLFGKQKQKGESLAQVVQSKTKSLVEMNKPWGLLDAQGGVFGELEEVAGVELFAVDIKNTLLTSGKAEPLGELLARSLAECGLVPPNYLGG